MNELHHQILSVLETYQKSERELVALLARADRAKLYLSHGCPSLFQYCVRVLGLTEDRTCALINVSRKAELVPELKAALDSGLTVSKAVRITSVLRTASREENTRWINQAMTLPKREIEKKVAEINPKAAVLESVKYVQAERLDLRLGISEVVHSLLRRVQDIESNKKGSHASFEVAIEAALRAYLSQHDPVERAKRRVKKTAKLLKSHPARADLPLHSPGPHNLAQSAVLDIEDAAPVENVRKSLKSHPAQAVQLPGPAKRKHKRRPISVKTRDELFLKANNQCTFHEIKDTTQRCTQTRWLNTF